MSHSFESQFKPPSYFYGVMELGMAEASSADRLLSLQALNRHDSRHGTSLGLSFMLRLMEHAGQELSQGQPCTPVLRTPTTETELRAVRTFEVAQAMGTLIGAKVRLYELLLRHKGSNIFVEHKPDGRVEYTGSLGSISYPYIRNAALAATAARPFVVDREYDTHLSGLNLSRAINCITYDAAEV